MFKDVVKKLLEKEVQAISYDDIRSSGMTGESKKGSVNKSVGIKIEKSNFIICRLIHKLRLKFSRKYRVKIAGMYIDKLSQFLNGEIL